MVNMYAFTYPSAINQFIESGFVLTKVGDSIRDIDVRMDEQGNSAEWEPKVKIGGWNNLTKIKRDYDVHEVLTRRGLHYKGGKGTEWFKIPGVTIDDVRIYLDQVITDLEGKRVRNQVTLRSLQQKTLDQAMAIVDRCAENGQSAANIIANLCPRFGKTIWALMLFNYISKKYKNRVMLLPAYWLGVHGSFNGELDAYNDFLDIREIDVKESGSAQTAWAAIEQGLRVVIPISLHGELDEWKSTHDWIASIPNDEIFMFADEGDFGTHTENQIAKLEFLFKE